MVARRSSPERVERQHCFRPPCDSAQNVAQWIAAARPAEETRTMFTTGMSFGLGEEIEALRTAGVL